MGVDLRLLPISHVDSPVSYAHTILPLERNSDAWPAVQALPSRDVPLGFATYLSRDEDGEMHYGETLVDGYGPLRMVRVKHLRTVESRQLLEQVRDINRAAFAYLDALDGDSWIALYWG